MEAGWRRLDLRRLDLRRRLDHRHFERLLLELLGIDRRRRQCHLRRDRLDQLVELRLVGERDIDAFRHFAEVDCNVGVGFDLDRAVHDVAACCGIERRAALHCATGSPSHGTSADGVRIGN